MLSMIEHAHASIIERAHARKQKYVGNKRGHFCSDHGQHRIAVFVCAVFAFCNRLNLSFPLVLQDDE